MRVVDYRVHPKPVVKFLLISITFWVIFRLKAEDCGLSEAVRYKSGNRSRKALRLGGNPDAGEGIRVVATGYVAMNNLRDRAKISIYVSITIDTSLLDVLDRFVPRWERLGRCRRTGILRLTTCKTEFGCRSCISLRCSELAQD
jgi:hypothetical protein